MHGVKKTDCPGTFYSWIHYLKKQGCPLPDVVPENLREKSMRENHEIVKVSIMEEIKVTSHKRAKKPKATYEEMFANLPHKIIPVDALSEEERLCPICDTLMEPIGKEVVRTELKYHLAKLERIDYVVSTYACI